MFSVYPARVKRERTGKKVEENIVLAIILLFIQAFIHPEVALRDCCDDRQGSWHYLKRQMLSVYSTRIFFFVRQFCSRVLCPADNKCVGGDGDGRKLITVSARVKEM